MSRSSPRGNENMISQTSTLPSSYFDPTSDEEWRFTGTMYLSEYEPEVYQQFLERPPELDEALRNLVPEDQLRYSKLERELRLEDEQEYRDIVETAKKRGTDPLETHGQIMLAMKEFTDERLECFARKLQDERNIKEAMERKKREKEEKKSKIKPKLAPWATVGEIRAAMTPEDRERKRLEEEAYFRREHEYLQRLKAREEEERARRYVPATTAKTMSTPKKSTKGLTYKEIQELKTKEQLETERRNLDAERRRMSEHFARVRAQDEEAFRARFPWKYQNTATRGTGRVGRLADMYENGKRFSTISGASNEESSVSGHSTNTPTKRLSFNSNQQITPPRLPSPISPRASTNQMRKKLIDPSKPLSPRSLFTDRRELHSRPYSDGAVAKRRTRRLGSAPDRLQKSGNLFDTPVSWGELDDEDEVFLWNSDDFENSASDESVFEDELSPRSGSGGTPSRLRSRTSSFEKSTYNPIADFVPYHPGEDTIWESEAKLDKKTKSRKPKPSLTSTPKRGGSKKRRRLEDPDLSFVDWRKAQSTLDEDDFSNHDEYSLFWGL